MAHLNIDPASKCFLGGLAYASNEDSLRNYFSQFGEVSEPARAQRNSPRVSLRDRASTRREGVVRGRVGLTLHSSHAHHPHRLAGRPSGRVSCV